MDMGIPALVVKGCVPAELVWRDLHRIGNLYRMCFDQLLPAFGEDVAQPGCVLAAQQPDERPYISWVLLNFLEGGIQRYGAVAE